MGEIINSKGLLDSRIGSMTGAYIVPTFEAMKAVAQDMTGISVVTLGEPGGVWIHKGREIKALEGFQPVAVNYDKGLHNGLTEFWVKVRKTKEALKSS